MHIGHPAPVRRNRRFREAVRAYYRTWYPLTDEARRVVEEMDDFEGVLKMYAYRSLL